jgi:hypothetical protein
MCFRFGERGHAKALKTADNGASKEARSYHGVTYTGFPINRWFGTSVWSSLPDCTQASPRD